MFSVLLLASVAQAVAIQPRWHTCDVDPYAGPPSVQTPLHTMLSLGTYSPFISQTSPFCRNVPDGFIIDQVSVVSRHGARAPTASSLKKIQATVNKLKGIKPTNESFRFVETYDVNGYVADELTNYGRWQLWESGKFCRERYPDLVTDNFTRASGQHRVIESGQYFLRGMSGAAFALINDTELPLPNAIISETEGLNNTLHPTNCNNDEAYQDQADQAPATWLDAYGPAVAAQLNSQLPGANLSSQDAQNLMSLCGYDAVKGLNYTEGPWCPVFDDDEWSDNEYWFDVQKWYGNGWGNPYVPAAYAGYVNELVARLTDEPVVAAGAVNATEDSVEFPLGKTFYADFTHDNDMVGILTAMGIGKEADLPTAPSSIPFHAFDTALTVPFAARFVIERLVSPDEARYVRILVNDAVVSLPFPGCGLYGYDGVCLLEAFVHAQEAHSDEVYWSQMCEGPPLNVTFPL